MLILGKLARQTGDWESHGSYDDAVYVCMYVCT